jgi:hypothetical protein
MIDPDLVLPALDLVADYLEVDFVVGRVVL